MSENLNKTDHDQSGNLRGTHLEGAQQGITTHPQEETKRQTKVVEDPERTGAKSS